MKLKRSVVWLIAMCSSICSVYDVEAQTVSNFTLVDADSDSDLFELVDGQVINFQDLPTVNLNVRANTAGTIGSVQFYLNRTAFRTENVAVYALAGNSSSNYFPWIPDIGALVIEAQVYAGSGASGALLDTASVSVTFIDEASEIFVTDVLFTNCPTVDLTLGDTVDLDVFITPSNATNQTIAFTASDGLSVEYLSGVFTANEVGSITVTATSFSDGAVFDQCLIDVVDSITTSSPYQTVKAIDNSGENGTQPAGGGSVIGYINNGDHIYFDRLDFERGPSTGTIRASSNTSGGQIEFRLGSETGSLLATSTITNTSGWTSFQDFSIDVVNGEDYTNGTTFLGVQDLYLVFTGGSGFLLDVDEFSFVFAEPEVLVTDVAITNCPTDSLMVGDVLDLEAVVSPANASNPVVIFTTSSGDIDALTGAFTATTSGDVTLTATSSSDTTVFDKCFLTIFEDVAGLSIDQLVLLDADFDLDIGPLEDGDTINLFNLSSTNLNVRVETNPSTVGSVGFEYNGEVDYATENFAPYALAGDAAGDFKPWTPTIGANVLTVTPYSLSGRQGDAGLSKTVNFFVTNEDTTTISNPSATITGELKKWHKVTLSFEGPSLSEAGLENPFADYRLDVTFTNGSKVYTVPGFYAADGMAENTSATSGNIWQVNFSPDELGTWIYSASFRTGADIATSTNQSHGTATAFDGQTGTFDILPSDKTGRDFRATGRLEYVGEHYLQFAETGKYFFKVGSDAPENTFAYEDFDATPNAAGRLKSWELHAGDFDLADAGEYTWGNIESDSARTHGRELLGVVKYLADQRMNVFSFLTYNIDGDDKNVYPHLQIVNDATTFDDVHHDRFDVSKLAQWEKVLEYADKLGVYIHFKTQETENDQNMDGGQLGRERKLYYRELVARFGHHLALNWNLGEENDIWSELSDPTNENVKDYAQFISDIDPYGHHIVIHTYPSQQDEVYDELLGSASELTGASIQSNIGNVHEDVRRWVEASDLAGKKWVVANDEQGGANAGVAVDADYPDSLLPESRNVSDNREAVRDQVLWGTMLAGGAGVEYYYGYQTGCDDLDCQDHRTRQTKWNDAKIALDFFQNYLEPNVTQMVSNDALTSSNDDYVFADEGELYAIYLASGGTTDLDLTVQSGSYKIEWYDPRNGGALQEGTVSSISGGSESSIGLPPSDTSEDWVALLTREEENPLSILIYHETAGFRHTGAISGGISMINGFATTYDWTVTNSQTSDVFNDTNLSSVDVVVWLNTSGNGLLTTSEQVSFEAFIQNGGGFVGVHAATDTYRDGSWSWYNDLVGAIVQTSPNHTSNNYNATIDVVGDHPAIDHLETEWNKSEEYYYWELNGGYLYSGNIDLLQVRSTGSNSYDAPRPITWYKEYDGGRSFYTALGHNGSDYSGDSDFITMMENAILWAGGEIEINSSERQVDSTLEPLEAETQQIMLYPNPVHEVLTVKMNKASESKVSIYDLSGKSVHVSIHHCNEIKLDLSALKSGAYLMEITQSGSKQKMRVLKK